MNIPKIIFIVPYRNREVYKDLFIRHMKYILEEKDKKYYEIIFSHQCDNKTFNRGAMKNLGFMYVKEKYPHHYKNITLVFNDVDTMPGKKDMFDYETKQGIIKHFYGFKFALGGIVSITGYDFERINGYPNFWGWGFEDNVLQKRALKSNLKIDRSQFNKFNDYDVLQFYHGKSRKLDDRIIYKMESSINGLRTIERKNYNIKNIEYNIILLNNTNWNIPEKEENIIYETRKNLSRISQPKISMSNLLRFSNKK